MRERLADAGGGVGVRPGEDVRQPLPEVDAVLPAGGREAGEDAIGTSPPPLPAKSQFRRPRQSGRMTLSQGLLSMFRRGSARCRRSSASRSGEWAAALATGDDGGCPAVTARQWAKHSSARGRPPCGGAASPS